MTAMTMNIPPDLSVLLVEDDNHIAELICLALESEGIAVRHADSGRAGLAAALERRPDLIITDYFMPNMGGIGLVQELRGNPTTRDVPVLMISALPVDADVPVNGSLLKPFTLDELFAAITELVH